MRWSKPLRRALEETQTRRLAGAGEGSTANTQTALTSAPAVEHEALGRGFGALGCTTRAARHHSFRKTGPTLRRRFQPASGGTRTPDPREGPKPFARDRSRRAARTEVHVEVSLRTSPKAPTSDFPPAPHPRLRPESLARGREALPKRAPRRPEGLVGVRLEGRRRAGRLGLPSRRRHRSGGATACRSWQGSRS